MRQNARPMLGLACGIILYALAMPPVGWWWTAPIGLFLLFGNTASFRAYFAAGCLLHLYLYSWIIPVSIPGWIGLSMLCALIWTLPFVFYQRIRSRLGTSALWVTLEGIRSFLGWGWLPLAASAVSCPPLLDWARLGGEALIGFLIIYSVLFALSAAKLSNLFFRSGISALIIFSGGAILGALQQRVNGNGPIKVGLIQPNVPTKESYTDQDNAAAVTTLHRLSANLQKEQPDILFWPEEALSWASANHDPLLKAWLEAGASTMKTPLVTGALWQELDRYYNAVILVDPREGVSPLAYKKRRLVPFGEYIPFSEFSWIRSLTPIVDSFAPGKKEVVINTPTKTAIIRIWPLICYEDTFDFLSDHAAASSDLMAVFINDGWFYPYAQSQHAAHSVLRAVEQGIPLLRISNNGLTGVITPDGASRYMPPDQAVGQTQILPLARVDTPFSHSGLWWRWTFAGIFICCCLLAKKTRT